MDVYQKRRVNALVNKVALDTRTVSCLALVGSMISDQTDLPVLVDGVIEEIALHMDEFSMTGVDQLTDGNVGGIKAFGGQEKFCRYISSRYLGSIRT